ncbi:hypothetical protein MSM1_15270 [Mycobacterium sp. SM1]|uniref:DUF6955 family protein n=1 Tax=Mycobacterium sp. SM1 TaxID=2816243 RepID=UPI001BCEE74A|nr:hypothetical protein [Mycobacterium sp. SM1]MBS4729647.1 hypothetical protein [Mycobacterium sp. SM1]
MSGNERDIRINVWINEERLDILKRAGLLEMAKYKFADMMVLEISATEEQKDRILQRYPSAQYDSSTTHSIELLPKLAKDRLFDLAVQMRATGPEVIDRFLEDGQA